MEGSMKNIARFNLFTELDPNLYSFRTQLPARIFTMLAYATRCNPEGLGNLPPSQKTRLKE